MEYGLDECGGEFGVEVGASFGDGFESDASFNDDDGSEACF